MNDRGTMETREFHPADIADQLERLPAEEANALLRKLPKDQAAAALIELDREAWPEFLRNLKATEISDLIKELPHDASADLIQSLPAADRKAVLSELPLEEVSEISALMKYPCDSVGGIMSDEFLAFQEDQTVEECQQALRNLADQGAEEGISYLYVTNRESHLVGIVSLRNLVFGRPNRKIGELMKRDVTHVRVDDDQERIAQLFEHYHYLALPVLEHSGKLVGIVVANQVIDVLQHEATEDMQLMVGLSGEERALTPWQKSMSRRLPWLCVNLATAFLAAGVVGLFEETIAAWTALAVFLPIVAGQGGNAGAQTLTVIIRDLALGEMSPGDGRKALYKELLLAVLNGLVIGIIVGVLGYLWKGSALLGVVVGSAMVLNMIAAALSGVLVPYTLKALRIDPALASSILVTTVTDVAGFFFFLGIAAMVLR